MDHTLMRLFGFLALLCVFVRCQICRDKYRVFPNHTMCLSWSNRYQYLTTNLDEILDSHNDIRDNVVPPAANMILLEYFKTLAIEAQIWAEQCTLSHDTFHSRFQPARYDVGQNILTSKTNLTWTTVIAEWRKENMTFKYGDTANKMTEVGNYAQIVNADTGAVGCGMSYCNGTHFYVCNYAPRIESYDLPKPYEVSNSGNSCDACPSHCNVNETSTMCSCEGKFCQNGGQLNLTTCECECVGGVNNYTAKFCELICEPNGDHIQCDTFSYADCFTNKTVNFMCPWKCGICPWGGLNYKEGTVPMPWDCQIPGNITNGRVHLTGFTEGKAAIYNCSQGYLMSTGNKTRVCHNGKWNGTEPTCHTLVEIQQMLTNLFKCSITGIAGSSSCLDPVSVNNGHVTVSTYHNVKIAVYSCEVGFNIQSGNQTRVCENGQWSGAEAACHAIVPQNISNQTNGNKLLGQGGCKRNDAERTQYSVFYVAFVLCLYMVI